MQINLIAVCHFSSLTAGHSYALLMPCLVEIKTESIWGIHFIKKKKEKKKKMDLASRTPGSKVSWFSSNSLALSDRVWVVPYSFIIFHLALPSFIFLSNMVTSSSKKPIDKCQTQGFYSTKQCVKSAWLRPLYGSRQTESTKRYDKLKMHLYTFLCLFVLLVI